MQNQENNAIEMVISMMTEETMYLTHVQRKAVVENHFLRAWKTQLDGEQLRKLTDGMTEIIEDRLAGRERKTYPRFRIGQKIYYIQNKPAPGGGYVPDRWELCEGVITSVNARADYDYKTNQVLRNGKWTGPGPTLTVQAVQETYTIHNRQHPLSANQIHPTRESALQLFKSTVDKTGRSLEERDEKTTVTFKTS